MNERHNLSEYIAALKAGGILVSAPDTGAGDIQILCLAADNRQVTPGAIFVCKGAHFREEYLTDAVRRGAVAYVSEKEYMLGSGEISRASAIIVSDVRRAMVYLSLLFFNNAPSHLTTVGITGTKGKSTTAYYIKAILDAYLERECAILSSIDNYDGVVREESHLTTPEPIDLHRHFHNAVESGISHLVMEVSSQALKYDRVFGLTLDVACFNNIGVDHISPIEHADFEDYFTSKLKIFDICKTACVNASCDHADRILAAAEKSGCRVITFGYDEDCDIYCRGAEEREDGTFFTVRTPIFEGRLRISMPGIFNVENALSAIAACTALGVPREYIEKGLARARAAGRMELFRSEDGRVAVIVDYAHNELSFRALYNSVAARYPEKRIITVFGCPGGKAQLRRRDLGTAAGKHSDYVIITEEDSGEEPFSDIAADIARFVRAEGCDFSVCEDRGQAIHEAVMEHGGDKVILITGKGRETRQKRGTLYIDTPSDVEYAEKFLAEYNASVPSPSTTI